MNKHKLILIAGGAIIALCVVGFGISILLSKVFEDTVNGGSDNPQVIQGNDVIPDVGEEIVDNEIVPEIESIVSILTGTGTSGFLDESLTAATFTLPYSLTVDKSGRLVIFDTFNNAIRRVDGDKLNTLVGLWIAEDISRFSHGFHRDGILGEALFNRPSDGVYNAEGTLFICDSENHVIRIIRDGEVFTFAGSEQGFMDGTREVARFNTPTAIAIDDNGNLYITDTLNNAIRRIDRDGSVTTIADEIFREPSGIAVSSDGRIIYVADTGNHRIVRIENGQVTTLAGIPDGFDEDGDPIGGYHDGMAEEAMFNLPKGLSLADDILFVADSGNNVIRAVNQNGRVLTAAGTGEPGDLDGDPLTAEFCQPTGVFWFDGILYIADTTNNRIKKLLVDLNVFRENS